MPLSPWHTRGVQKCGDNLVAPSHATVLRATLAVIAMHNGSGRVLHPRIVREVQDKALDYGTDILRTYKQYMEQKPRVCFYHTGCMNVQQAHSLTGITIDRVISGLEDGFIRSL